MHLFLGILYHNFVQGGQNIQVQYIEPYDLLNHNQSTPKQRMGLRAPSNSVKQNQTGTIPKNNNLDIFALREKSGLFYSQVSNNNLGSANPYLGKSHNLSISPSIPIDICNNIMLKSSFENVSLCYPRVGVPGSANEEIKMHCELTLSIEDDGFNFNRFLLSQSNSLSNNSILLIIKDEGMGNLVRKSHALYHTGLSSH